MCSETGFLTCVPPADQCLQLLCTMTSSLPLFVFSDIFSSAVEHAYSTRTNIHTVVSIYYLYLCSLSTSVLPTHIPTVTFFPYPRRFLECPWRFGSPQSKSQKTLKNVFQSCHCQSVLNIIREN